MNWPEAGMTRAISPRADRLTVRDIDLEVVRRGSGRAIVFLHGFHTLDLWESRESFEAFARDRLTPGVQKIGIQGQPNVRFETAVAIFAPNPG